MLVYQPVEVSLLCIAPNLTQKGNNFLLLWEENSKLYVPHKNTRSNMTCIQTADEVLFENTGYRGRLGQDKPGWIDIVQRGVFDGISRGEGQGRLITIGYCCIIPEDTILKCPTAKWLTLMELQDRTKDFYSDHFSMLTYMCQSL